MKYLLSLAALLLSGLAAAITPEDIIGEFRTAPEKSGGIYYAYPFTTDSVPSAPEGYQAVYISHYGRHGSRWAINEKQYPYVIDILEQHQDAGNLTEEGIRTLRKVKAIAAHAEGHAGELSPLGQRQHKAIARRMMARNPHLFADSTEISALSSTVPRCIVSMAAFSESLKEMNPNLQISRSASPGDMAFISYTTTEAKKVANDTSGWRADHKKFRENVVPKERLLKLLFKETPDLADPTFFLKTLHDIAVTTQNVEFFVDSETGEEVNLLPLFTPEELFGFWQAINYNMYVRHANSPEGKSAGMLSARSLLDDIVNRADKALSQNGGPRVQLRFGHDTNLIRLLALMQLEGFAESESDPYKYYAAWQDYKVSPMGANLQLIFFQPDEVSNHPQTEINDKTDKTDNSEKTDKSGNTVKSDNSAKTDKSGNTVKSDNSAKTNKSGNTVKSDNSEKTDKSGNTVKSDNSEKTDKSAKDMETDIDEKTLVLILHNERPVTVPIQSPSAPFYPWKDLKHLWN